MERYSFEEFKKEKPTSIWSQFLREKNGQAAKCKICEKIIKCSGGSTSVLHTHIRSIHNINISKRNSTDQPSPSNTLTKSLISCMPPKNKLTDYFSSKRDESLPAILSRMTASDGIPFSVFCTSKDLRMLLLAKGFRDIPKSSNTIRNMVVNYGKKICQQITTDLSDKKKKLNYFSLTFDEWTSIKNRRYLNINVHSKEEFWNLGLMRVWGSMPADKCVNLLKKKLNEFGLSLDTDIVCICTDGASVMRKVGQLLNIDQQLCFAHGIQLGVLDILYPKSPLSTSYAEVDSINENENISVLCDADDVELSENSDSDEDDYSSEVDVNANHILNFSISANHEEGELEILSHSHVVPLTKKIRRVVKMFRRSPTKNDQTLQKYVRADFGAERNLILDSKTRWNSLIIMFERFYELRSCIQKALIDLNVNSSYMVSEKEFKVIADIIAVLLPVKLAVESLCRQNANLLTADATFNFMFSNLEKCNSAFSHEISGALLERIKQRRTQLSGVLQYLHNKYKELDSSTSNLSRELFPKLKKGEIIKIIVTLLKRTIKSGDNENESIHDENRIEQVENIVPQAENTPVIPSTASLKEMMQRSIDKQLFVPPLESKGNIQNLTTRIRREITIFEDEGVRGQNLELMYKILLSIPPTSVEAERAFSSAGQICTKIRSRLSDESINILCTLRAYFQKIDD